MKRFGLLLVLFQLPFLTGVLVSADDPFAAAMTVLGAGAAFVVLAAEFAVSEIEQDRLRMHRRGF